MQGESPVNVVVMRCIKAAPERVFDAWLDRKGAGEWLFATPAGEMVRVEIDARVGGKFVFIDRRNGESVEHVGEFLDIDRPRRLAFRFAVPKFSPQFTRVTIDLLPAANGCELTLTHEGVPPDYANRTEDGWNQILDGLGAAVL